MKQVSCFTALMAAGIVSAMLFSSCSSQAQNERPAARQRSAASDMQQLSRSGSATHDGNRSNVPVVRAASPAPAQENAGGEGSVESGKEVFEQCGICHNIDSDEAKMGPSLQGLFKKEKLANGKPANEESVRQVINDGGNGMPGYEELLEADEMRNLMAYLRTL